MNIKRDGGIMKQIQCILVISRVIIMQIRRTVLTCGTNIKAVNTCIIMFISHSF